MYLVRTKDTQRLVGVFAAPNPVDLFNTVDEELDPFSCEYFQLSAGQGLFLEGQFVTRQDIEAVDFVAIEPVDALQASGIRMTEKLDLALPLGTDGWQSFTKGNLAEAFGVPAGALNDPQVKALFTGNMGIYAPSALN